MRREPYYTVYRSSAGEPMWYAKDVKSTLKELDVDPTTGLSEKEAERRLIIHGLNKLVEKKRKSVLRLLVEQMNNVLIYILIAAAGISAALGEGTDAVIIGIVVILNAIIGVIQESKAEKALEELKRLSSPKAVVRREGQLKEISSETIAPGDIIILEAGRIVPCDLRLVEAANLRVEESALTGESVPVEKDARLVLDPKDTSLGDQRNMAFMSTITTYGRGAGIAVGTAMNTEIGKIATLLEKEEDEHTPLQEKLDRLARSLGFVILALCALMFGISVGKQLISTGGIPRDYLFQWFLTAVSLAVAAIPEGLPAIVTIVLALGVQKMIRQHAIVRKLPAVETLGSVNIICTDKTGTLTQNRMTVTRFYTEGTYGDISSLDPKNPVHRMLLMSIVLCNDAGYSPEASAGDPTEIALLEAGYRFSLDKEDLLQTHPRVYEVPFDSVRKLMTTVHTDAESYLVVTKGAPQNLIRICSKVYKGDRVIQLTDELKFRIMEQADSMSRDALRVLGAAFKKVSSAEYSPATVEEELVFVGFVGMIDPPRLEVKDSIALCKRAGVKTIMITGDHKNTAFAIARELGIAEHRSEVIDGLELDTISQGELNRRVAQLRVFARVSPEHKVKIVKALKASGAVVSMTGDGVNDAPSLKAADIGVAMGRVGTDVAKGASDMILTDDNFTTIVEAVEEGRIIFKNIKKTVIFLLSSNAGEFLSVFTAMLLGWPPLLLPIHILWVNLITDTLPALSLGVDPGDPDVLREPPRSQAESLFARGAGTSIIGNGVLIGIITLFAYMVGFKMYEGSVLHARTLAFAVLSVSQLFHAFNLRHTSKSIVQVGSLINRYLIGALGVGWLLQFLVINFSPLASVFKVMPLQARDWLIVAGISVQTIVFNEIVKVFVRLVRKKPNKGMR